MSRTGFICEEQIFWHDNGSALLSVPAGGLYQPGQHVESAVPKRRFKGLVEVSGIATHLRYLSVSQASDEDILRFHTRRYLAELKAASEMVGGQSIGELCVVGRGSFEIAARSAGAVISGVTAVANGEVANAYCVTRPSGHHAEPDLARGFCLLGNIPIAIEYAKKHLNLERIAVIDWDVHHGNGTELGFYDRADVLTVSIHEAFNFPFDSGQADHIGSGSGEGFNVNIPLPPGSGSGAYEAAFTQIVEPKVRAFQPEMIIIASGYDASFFDPMGHQLLSAANFGQLAIAARQLADEVCGGKLVVVHEGGYSEGYSPLCAMRVLEVLTEVGTELVDPYGDVLSANPAQILQPHQAAIIDAVAKLHGLQNG